MPVTMGGSLAFCGRPLSPNNLELIRQVTHDFPRLSLTELSRTLCELLHWRRANGALKTRECYSFLQQLQARGWLASLPPIRLTSPRRPHTVRLDAQSDPGAPLTGALGDYLPLELFLLQTLAERRLFQQYVRRYHYLGYRVPYGAQLRYFVRSSRSFRPLLACLLFTSPAWKMAPRDTWIGWSDAARQLPQDWFTLYHLRPLLLETLVEVARFSGTCYRAANWIYVGTTQGRGRMDRSRQAQGRSPKHIFLYPLSPPARARLCQEPSPSSPPGDPSRTTLNPKS